MPSERRFGACAWLGSALVAATYTYDKIWLQARGGIGVRAFDIYAYSLPNFVYAREALRRGYGLLWNDLQNCGQPFFAIISSALLYPPNLLFLVADDPHRMIFVHALLNLALVAGGMLLLCREIGLGRLAAFCGALALQLGGGSLSLAHWNFALHAPYAWLPWALFCTERILRRPSTAAGIGLGVVLTLQLLAAFPQTQLFTYQLIGLRALFELATRRGWPPARALLALGLGLALPGLLAAVQLLPSLELARESVRSAPLTPEEETLASFRWDQVRELVGARTPGVGTVFSVVGLALAGFALTASGTSRIAWFGTLVASLYLALSAAGPLTDLYRGLPVFGRLFRDPGRFHWVASFGYSLVVACGVDALMRKSAPPGSRFAGGLAASGAAVAAFAWLSPARLYPSEWALLAATLAAVLVSRRPGVSRAVAGLAIAALLFSNLYFTPRTALMIHFEDGSVLFQKERLFSAVKRHASEQDRMYQFGRHGDFSLTPKSASVFGIPSITDYEPQTSRRYAEVLVRLLTSRPMTTLNDYYYLLRLVPTSRPLLDLLAVRYLVVDGSPGISPGIPADSVAVEALRPPLRLRWQDGDLRVYENQQALPRAFYVPRAEVVADPAEILERLASPTHRPTSVALIEEPPADGFLGGRRGGRGTVEILHDRAEQMALRVRASDEGFLFVSDQHYPGWEARVNGVPVAIARANHAFRLVRVPRGESTVAFRYRPASLRLGAAISLLTLSALAACGARAGARRLRGRGQG